MIHIMKRLIKYLDNNKNRLVKSSKELDNMICTMKNYNQLLLTDKEMSKLICNLQEKIRMLTNSYDHLYRMLEASYQNKSAFAKSFDEDTRKQMKQISIEIDQQKSIERKIVKQKIICQIDEMSET